MVISDGAVPLLIVDGVLDGSLVRDLLAHADREGWVASPMVRPGPDGNAVLVPDDDVKARFDHLLVDQELTARVQRSFVDRLLPAAATAFAQPIRSHEAFKIVRYDAGAGWFTAHRDNEAPDARHRRLAVTVNLDEDFEGGHLRFPEFGTDEFRPRPGAAIVFSCSLLHEVTPVRRGSRHALLTFLW
ncbi:MAG: 2OG-Fe(II) oxygenase [Actinobacteria bacterium]|nr:2OG-Fe(II) oxygenase [Actinomycetota bacterium]